MGDFRCWSLFHEPSVARCTAEPEAFCLGSTWLATSTFMVQLPRRASI